MTPTNPTESLNDAPFAELITILLRQLRNLLNERGVKLSNEDIQAVAQALENREAHPHIPAIQDAMKHLVNESLDLLQARWGYSFAQSLQADMSDIGGWETTEEFLDIANHKSNAELRVSAGSALLVALGDSSYQPYLMTVIDHDAGLNDVDAVLAKRVLAHANIDTDS